VGGAAPVLTRFRAIALATVMAALAVWGTVAADLPSLRESLAVTVAALVVLPAFTLAIWLALPLALYRATWLLVAAAAAGGLWAGFYFVDFEIASNISKLSCFVLFGLWFLSLFEFLWWLALVALLVPWVDIWSVAFGPTRYVTEEKPQFFDSVSIALHVPGQTATANIGPPDIVFFALFLAAAQRFHLRIAWTWICMTGFLSLTLVAVWLLDSSGLPALPAVCLGFLLPNADLIWRNARDAWVAYAAKRAAPEAKG
jgi:hypothetical protein